MKCSTVSLLFFFNLISFIVQKLGNVSQSKAPKVDKSIVRVHSAALLDLVCVKLRGHWLTVFPISWLAKLQRSGAKLKLLPLGVART